MSTNELLKKLKNFVDTDRRERIAKYESLKSLLKKLKAKENLLKDKIKNGNDDSDDKYQTRLTEKIRVLKAQRKKGLKLLKELKSEIYK